MQNQFILTTPAELEQLIYNVVERVISNNYQVKNKDDPEISYPKIMGIEQTSSMLGISKSTLYRYTSQRLIPFHKKYQKIYFKKEDIEKWINETRKENYKNLKNKKNEKTNKYLKNR
jgi:excisionase family DNA binding protein